MLPRWATRRLARFILGRLLGRFLETDLSHEQIEVHLGSASVHLSGLRLNTEYLNSLLENNGNGAAAANGVASTAAAAARSGVPGSFQNKPNQALPTVRFVSGHVEKLSASLPIVTLSSLDQPCTVNLDGLTLVAVVSPPGQSGAREGREGGKLGKGVREEGVGESGVSLRNSGGERGGTNKGSETEEDEQGEEEEEEEEEDGEEEEEEEEEEREEGMEGMTNGGWGSFPGFQGGIQLVAGLVEKVLQRLQVSVTHVQVHIVLDNGTTQFDPAGAGACNGGDCDGIRSGVGDWSDCKGVVFCLDELAYGPAAQEELGLGSAGPDVCNEVQVGREGQGGERRSGNGYGGGKNRRSDSGGWRRRGEEERGAAGVGRVGGVVWSGAGADGGSKGGVAHMVLGGGPKEGEDEDGAREEDFRNDVFTEAASSMYASVLDGQQSVFVDATEEASNEDLYSSTFQSVMGSALNEDNSAMCQPTGTGFIRESVPGVERVVIGGPAAASQPRHLRERESRRHGEEETQERFSGRGFAREGRSEAVSAQSMESEGLGWSRDREGAPQNGRDLGIRRDGMRQGEGPVVAVAVQLSPVVIQADVTLVKGVLEVLGRLRGEEGGEEGREEEEEREEGEEERVAREDGSGEGLAVRGVRSVRGDEGDEGEEAAASSSARSSAAVAAARTAAIQTPSAAAAAAAAISQALATAPPQKAAAVWADNYVEDWLGQRLVETRRVKEERRRANQRAEEEAADMEASMSEFFDCLDSAMFLSSSLTSSLSASLHSSTNLSF
ncbi:unnamed protein product [Closterium sp. NIES-64]|nr:unnamed protein product [Closterium sp. NIES-64]